MEAGRKDLQDLAVFGSLFLMQEPAVIAAAGALPKDATLIDIQSGGAIALTLADPTGSLPKLMILYMSVDGGAATLTPSNLLGYTSIAFNDVGDACVLWFNGSDWVILSNQGCTLA